MPNDREFAARLRAFASAHLLPYLREVLAETTAMTKEEALERARAIADADQWGWLEPVNARREGNTWIVRTNYYGLGSYLELVFDDTTGDVISKRQFRSR